MNKAKLQKAITAGLKQSMQAHGIITKQHIGSASKRIMGSVLRCISQEETDESKHPVVRQ